MTETLVNIQKLLAEVRQCLLEAQKAFNDQSALLSKTTSELHAALNLAAASSLKRSERDTALTRAEQDEESAAAMREALDRAEEEQAWGAAVVKALLPYQYRYVRVLLACQSLHRAWRRERDEAKAVLSGVLAITPAGRLPFDGWEKELTADRDAAQRALAVCVMQRDEAREALRRYRERHDEMQRVGDCHCPLCKRATEILEVKP